MMVLSCYYLLASICLLVSPLLHTDAYVLKRSQRYTDDNDRLADALKVINRERRRIRESELYDDYYWNEGVPAAAGDYPGEYGDSGEFLRDLFGELGKEELAEREELPDQIDPRAFSDYVEEVTGNEASDLEEAPVDESELEDIFGSDDQEDEEDNDIREDKRTIPWQLGGRGGLPNDKPDKKSDDAQEELTDNDIEDVDEEGNDVTKTQLSTDEVAKLLEDAEEVSQEAAEEEAAKSTEPVSEEELKDMLEGDDSDNPDVDAAEAPSEETFVEEDIPADEKEELSEIFLPQSSERSVKRKRSGNAVEQMEVIEEETPVDILEQENAVLLDTQEECLRQFIDLEDDENTKLAQALSLATFGQVEHTDAYIAEEIEYLRAAVNNEERINELRECLRLTTRARGVGGVLEDEDVVGEGKRMEEPPVTEELLEDIPEQTEEADIRDMLAEKLKLYMLQNDRAENEIDPEIFDVQEDVEDPALNPFYRELYEQYAAQAQPAKRTYESEGVFDDFDDDNEILTEEDAEEEIRDRLGNYISEMTPGEREELKEEVAEALSAITEEIGDEEKLEEEICPAITSLTDDCDSARQMGLSLDDEAEDLCNRHQLCYTCGSYFGIDYTDCDQGYLREAQTLCDDDGECSDEAAGLFVVMARSHAFVDPSQTEQQCRDQCVLDYIVGLGGSNL